MTAVARTDSTCSAAPTVAPARTIDGSSKIAQVRILFVSQSAFTLVWVVVIAAHMGCATFLVTVGMLYRYLLKTNVLESFMIFAVSVKSQYYVPISNIYYALASTHVVMIILCIVRSVRSREFVFRMPPTHQTNSTLSETLRHMLSGVARSRAGINRIARTKISPSAGSTQTLVPRIISKTVDWIWTAVAACVAAMDIHDENYGHFFLFRELVQTFIQTYQAYRLSYLVPRLWMNDVIVFLLALNCWSTLLIEFVFCSSVEKTRLSCAIVSVILDIVSCIVIPLVLFGPYYKLYNPVMKTFDDFYWFTDKWLIQMINELQLLFVTSLYDAISKLLIASSVVRWLHAITKLVESTSNQPDTSSMPAAAHVSTRTRTLPVAVVPAFLQNAPSANLIRMHTRRRWRNNVEAAGHKFLVLWGALLLVVHFHALSISGFPQCRLHPHPWFSMKPGCSLLEFNCIQENATGTADEIERLLERVNAHYIEHLVIRHCPNLQVPPYLKHLKYLLAVKFFNVSTLEWGEDAALTNFHHPALQVVYLVEVDMAELPQGVLSANFPQTLYQMMISRTNLTFLPDNLDMIWSKGMFLLLEEYRFTEFPLVIPRMRPRYLSLALNNLSSIPDALFDAAYLTMLILNGNPIQSLPTNLSDSSLPFLGWILILSTKISALLDWMNTSTYLSTIYILANTTPLCDRMVSTGEAAHSLTIGPFSLAGIDCTTTWTESLNAFPIGTEDERNPSYVLT
ncbi:hypothetical protein FI667_g8261, partial [Globisporangium splendens]